MPRHKGRAAPLRAKQSDPGRTPNPYRDYIADQGFCTPESRVERILGQAIAFSVSAAVMAVALAVLR